MASFARGDIFTSYAEFEARLQEYQQREKVLFIKTNSKRIVSGNDEMRSRFVYEFVLLACKQGKRIRESESKGIRINQKSCKMGCEAKIRLGIKRIDNDFVLQIVHAQLQHSNHPVNAETFNVYPENRVRKVEKDDIVIAMVKANIRPVDLKSFIKTRHGINLLQKDVHNLRRKILSTPESEDEVKKGLQLLSNEISHEGGRSWLSFDGDGNLKHFIFRTKQMRQDFKRFPDILVIDIVHSVNSNGYPLCNVLSIDSNGNGRPILHAVMSHQGRNSISACLRVLKQCCPKGPCIIFVDKEFEEVSLITEIFPDIKVLVAAFHGASLMTNALHKSHISTPTQNIVLDLFKEQKDTSSEQRYKELIQEISSLIPEDAKSHFDSKWWNSPEIWASHAIGGLFTLHSTAVLNIDKYVLKIKSGKSRLCSLTSLCKSIRTLIDNDQEMSCGQNSLESLSDVYLKNQDLVRQITNHLTSFGASLVLEQLQIKEKTTYDIFVLDDTIDYVIIDNNVPDLQHIVNNDKCSCDFFHSCRLPCHHIFALREYLQLPLYDESSSRFSQSTLEMHEKCTNCESDEMELSNNSETQYTYESESDEMKHTVDELVLPPLTKSEDIYASNATTSNTTTSDTATTSISKSTTAITTITAQHRKTLIASLTSQITGYLLNVEDRKFKRYMHQLEKFLKLVKENKPLLIVDLSEAENDEFSGVSSSSFSSTNTFSMCVNTSSSNTATVTQAKSPLPQNGGICMVSSTPTTSTPSATPDESSAAVADSTSPPSSTVNLVCTTAAPSMSVMPSTSIASTPSKPESNATTTSFSKSVSPGERDTKPVKYIGRVGESTDGIQNSPVSSVNQEVMSVLAFPNCKKASHNKRSAERVSKVQSESERGKRRCTRSANSAERSSQYN